MDDARAAALAADDARTRAVAALEDLALEHGGGHVDRQAWGGLLVDATLLKIAGDGITGCVVMHRPTAGCAAARAALDTEGAGVVAALGREADAVATSGVGAGPTQPALRLDVPPSLDECLASHAHDGLAAAVGLVWVHEWLALVGERPR